MKKYEKPQIIIESFSLSNNIASNCELQTSLPSLDDRCGYPIRGGATLFIEGADCTYKQQDGTYKGACYYVPSEENNLFGS